MNDAKQTQFESQMNSIIKKKAKVLDKVLKKRQQIENLEQQIECLFLQESRLSEKAREIRIALEKSNQQ